MTKAEIIEAIKEMSVLDLADLVNELAEVFGVDPPTPPWRLRPAPLPAAVLRLRKRRPSST